MENSNKPIYVKPFITERAGIKASISAEEIALYLLNEIKGKLLKKGYKLSESENESIVISGEFVMISGGNQFLRWLIGPFGVGATKLEVEGTINDNGKEINKFNFSKKGRGGIFGGNSKNLLISNTGGIAKDIIALLK